MAITEKNRKILWARSGNRCAICRTPLVVDKTSKDDESVIAAECHIISSAPNGPRHDPSYPASLLDSLENFILLCATHHKMVDDQPETHTAEILRSIKSNHEKWVETKLDESSQPQYPRVRRFKQNIPTKLPRIKSGQELLTLAMDCCGHYFRHDEGLSNTETEAVANFAQEIADWTDIASTLEPYDFVRYSSQLQGTLDDLEKQGFFVFVAKEVQQLEGGVDGPAAWPVLHIHVLRSTNQEVQYAAIKL